MSDSMGKLVMMCRVSGVVGRVGCRGRELEHFRFKDLSQSSNKIPYASSSSDNHCRLRAIGPRAEMRPDRDRILKVTCV